MDTRALKEDLIESAEAFPPGARAYVFSKLLVFAAKKLGLKASAFFSEAERAIENVDTTYEDRTLLVPPPEETIERFDKVAKRIIIQYEPHPTYGTLSVLLQCIGHVVRQGVPKVLIRGFLHSLWSGVPLVVAKAERGEEPRDDQMNGVPWFSNRR